MIYSMTGNERTRGAGAHATTMSDVATAAGVSRSTVSRVLSGTTEVSARVRNKVMSAVDQLGYVPSSGAQQLAAGRSRSIGLLIRDPRNPTYGLLQSQVQKWAEEFRLDVVTASPTFYRGAPQETAALRRLIGMRVGGLLVATGVVRTKDIRQFLPMVPVVSVGRPEDDPNIYGVSYDEIDNGTQIAHAVHASGHRDVAVMVTRHENSLAEHTRAMMTAQVLEELGCAVRRIDIQLFGVGGQGHTELIEMIKAHAVTAAVFPADHRMLDFVTHARRLGVEVPRDVSVIGCDGIMDGLDYMGLATLRVPVELVARRAVEVIASMLEDRSQVEVLHESYPGTVQSAPSLATIKPPSRHQG
jgi:DNA-binding LacI/PurR family transcriptional regulator